MVRVKICCISSIEEAALAVQYGAAALGLVSAMPSGPGVIPEDLITAIAATIPPAVASFLLTSKQEASAIIAQQHRCRVNALQLCDYLSDETYAQLHVALPGIHLVQVIHVTGEDAFVQAQHVTSYVDAILLDSGNPSLPVKELGGTGRLHDWQISRKICQAVSVPVFLAGGLHPSNVRQAISQVHPYGVDVCSGVRTNGRLDEQKLQAFFEAVDAAGV